MYIYKYIYIHKNTFTGQKKEVHKPSCVLFLKALLAHHLLYMFFFKGYMPIVALNCSVKTTKLK